MVFVLGFPMPVKMVKTLLLWISLVQGGCLSGGLDKSNQDSALKELTQKNQQLQSDLIRKNKQIAKLTQQLRSYQGFASNRYEHLIKVYQIKFGRYTLAYDEDEDGFDEGIIIYLKLLDEAGDKIKAAGEVDIELWDLAANEGDRYLNRWHFDLEEMQKYWRGGFLANHYRFTFPWPDKKPSHPNVTLKIRFKDGLTGNVFEIQKLINVSLAAHPVDIKSPVP